AAGGGPVSARSAASTREAGGDRREAFERLPVLVAPPAVQQEEPAAEAEVADLPDPPLGHRLHQAEADREVERLDRTPHPPGVAADRDQRALDLVPALERDPAVAVLEHPPRDPLRLHAAPEQDRRPALLERLGPAPDRVEVDELAVELRRLPGPDLPHLEDALARDHTAVDPAP